MNVVSSFFGNLGKFWQKTLNSRLLRLCVVLLIAQIVLIIWFYNQLPPEIPLYFSRPWGESWLAPSSMIFILPLLSLIVLLTNYFLAIFYHQRKLLLAQLLVIFAFIISLFSTVSVLKIISLVI
ncbi:MAG: hypothetical protein WC503_01290 [Candidatus Shapirobacteria bacterium]